MDQNRQQPTLAISLQLRPASRIVFSRCSSSAVHGVLVLPFFLGGASGTPGPGSSAASPAAAVVPDVDMVVAVLIWGEARRFLGLGGES